MAVILELAPGDTLMVGKNTRIRMVSKSGQRARLSIDSHEDVERIKAGDESPAVVPQAASGSAGPAQPFLRRPTAS